MVGSEEDPAELVTRPCDKPNIWKLRYSQGLMCPGVTTQVVTLCDEQTSPKHRHMFGDVMGIVSSEDMRDPQILYKNPTRKISFGSG